MLDRDRAKEDVVLAYPAMHIAHLANNGVAWRHYILWQIAVPKHHISCIIAKMLKRRG